MTVPIKRVNLCTGPGIERCLVRRPAADTIRATLILTPVGRLQGRGQSQRWAQQFLQRSVPRDVDFPTLLSRSHALPRRLKAFSLSRGFALYALIVITGLVVGAIWFALTPATYTGEYRIAIGQSTVSAAQVPGYTTAEAQLASNYARLLQDNASERTAVAPPGSSVKSVTASPIPGSSVIRVEAQASSAFAASESAKTAASRLKKTIEAANGDVSTAAQDFRNAYTAYISAKAAAEAATNKASALLAQLGPKDPAYLAAAKEVQQTASQEALLNLKQLSLGNSYQTAFANAKNASVSLVGAPGPAKSDVKSVAEKAFGVPLVIAIAIILIIAYVRNRRFAAVRELPASA